jgi:ribosomal protein S18 acetylase RimI-like enzyme
MKTISKDMLDGGFFFGWPNPPDAAAHLRLLRGSYLAYAAIDTATGKVAGFINAISDGVLSAYIPLLEVLPKYQGRGIGGTLVKHMLDDLSGIYMIDIVCDENIQPFYAKFGAINWTASIFRNYCSTD